MSGNGDPGRGGTAAEPRSSAGMRRSTGRDRAEWFALLDDWGAAGREYRAIADWLTGEHDLTDWWAQKLIVEYEEARGLREPGVRRDGTFEIGASKTVAVPIERLFDAFAGDRQRGRWLPGVEVRERISEQHRSLRLDWGDGSRIVASFEAQGEAKSQVVLQHLRLADAATAQRMKSFWRERLGALKSMLETP